MPLQADAAQWRARNNLLENKKVSHSASGVAFQNARNALKDIADDIATQMPPTGHHVRTFEFGNEAVIITADNGTVTIELSDLE